MIEITLHCLGGSFIASQKYICSAILSLALVVVKEDTKLIGYNTEVSENTYCKAHNLVMSFGFRVVSGQRLDRKKNCQQPNNNIRE